MREEENRYEKQSETLGFLDLTFEEKKSFGKISYTFISVYTIG